MWIAVENTHQITNAPGKLRKRATARHLDFFQLNRSLDKRINGINAWAVGVVLYSAGIMDWTVEELVSMGRKTWKILAMNCVIHTRSNIGRLYLANKGRGEVD